MHDSHQKVHKQTTHAEKLGPQKGSLWQRYQSCQETMRQSTAQGLGEAENKGNPSECVTGEAEMPALPEFESYPGTAGRCTPAQNPQAAHISYAD